MNDTLILSGVARNLTYTTLLKPPLRAYDIATFDINTAQSFGIVHLDDSGNGLGYSRWVSPKRTRSYPFARIYNTYHLPKKVTIIPIIKDEGLNGDNDRLNFITLSWMNLMNVYIILAWYDQAGRHTKRAGKISAQTMNADYIRERLVEISHYHQTALHWNTMHFERDFETIYRRAVESYRRISTQTGIPMHSSEEHLTVLNQCTQDGRFSIEAFKAFTLPRSQAAAQREITTLHLRELLGEGEKKIFLIHNWLGGEYHLTADEIFLEDGTLIIQEAKNATRSRIPSENDIKDGLFKLILFANMDKLMLGEQEIPFAVRLKLTGNFQGMLRLPSAEDEVTAFLQHNRLSQRAAQTLHNLNREVTENARLSAILAGNYA